MVVMALKTIVDHRSWPYPAAQNDLRVLGHKHYLRGIHKNDYFHFETSLLTTLGAFHGPRWSKDLALQWKRAFQQAAQLMGERHVDDFSRITGD